jgi:hypothetical protein
MLTSYLRGGRFDLKTTKAFEQKAQCEAIQIAHTLCAAAAATYPPIVFFSDLSTGGARISYVEGKHRDTGDTGHVVISDVISVGRAANFIVDYLRAASTESLGCVAAGADDPRETAWAIGLDLVKRAVPVSELVERDLEFVETATDTPIQRMAKSVLAAQRHLPMAFPNMNMYS